MGKLNQESMQHRLIIRVNDSLFQQLQSRADQENMQLSAYTRYLLNAALCNKDPTDEDEMQITDQIQRVMLKSNIQILSLSRFLASKQNPESVKQAIQESEDVIEHLYGGADDE